MPAKNAMITTTCDVSVAMLGNISDGIATSNTTKNARANAPASCVNTAHSLQLGSARYVAALLFQLDPALFGGMPQICLILAFFPGAAQLFGWDLWDIHMIWLFYWCENASMDNVPQGIFSLWHNMLQSHLEVAQGAEFGVNPVFSAPSQPAPGV